MTRFILKLLIVVCLSSCTNYLGEDEVKFMPYKSGDLLIFENLSDNSIDTIKITTVDRYVPDGPQIYFNETISARNQNNDHVVLISAGYGKNSDPYLKIRGIRGRYYLKDIDDIEKISLKTKTRRYDDVIILHNEDSSRLINQVYWSRSSGIVQYLEKNHISWQLVEVRSQK